LLWLTFIGLSVSNMIYHNGMERKKEKRKRKKERERERGRQREREREKRGKNVKIYYKGMTM